MKSHCLFSVLTKKNLDPEGLREILRAHLVSQTSSDLAPLFRPKNIGPVVTKQGARHAAKRKRKTITTHAPDTRKDTAHKGANKLQRRKST